MFILDFFFESVNGVFDYSGYSGYALIFANISEVNILINCSSFSTGIQYDYVKGSETRLLHVYRGVSVIFENVVFKEFKIKEEQFIRIGENETSAFKQSELIFVNVEFINIVQFNKKNLGIIDVNNSVVILENVKYNTSTQGDKAFLHLFVIYMYM
jgi:hypothetical protein